MSSVSRGPTLGRALKYSTAKRSLARGLWPGPTGKIQPSAVMRSRRRAGLYAALSISKGIYGTVKCTHMNDVGRFLSASVAVRSTAVRPSLASFPHRFVARGQFATISPAGNLVYPPRPSWTKRHIATLSIMVSNIARLSSSC